MYDSSKKTQFSKRIILLQISHSHQNSCWPEMSDFSKNPMGNHVLHSNNCIAWTQVPGQGPIFKKNKKGKYPDST